MAITELRIKAIEHRLEELQQSFIQTQRNQVPIVEKVDETSNKVDAITTYTATQSASYGDTEVVFEDVPQGLIICEVTDSEGNEIFYNLERNGNTVSVDFEPLDYAADVTISIQ